jgi:predicted ribosome quality control (RQC) complex YloA/Tae2 family protein
MKPSRAKDLIHGVAEELHIPEEVCKIVIDEYWHRVRKTITDSEHAKIYISKIGTIRVRYNTLLLRIKKYENLIAYYERLDKKTMSSETARKRLTKLYELKNQMDEHYNKKQKNKQTRRVLYKDLVESLFNTGGVEEQSS